jgi:hypothetical protein
LRNGHTDAAVVVTIHPYDIAESGEEFPEFRRKHGQKQVSLRSVIEELERIGGLARVELSSVTRMVDGGEDLSMERAQANLRLRESVVTRYHLLPAVLGLYPQYGLYYSMDAAERLYSRQKYAAVVLYGALVLLAGLVTGAVLRKISYRWGKAALVTGLASLIGIAGIGTIFAVSGFHAIFVYAVACCLGGLAGALVSGRSP